MPISTSDRSRKLTDFVKTLATETGFDICRIADADTEPVHGENLSRFVEAGHHGTMAWMEETRERRASRRTSARGICAHGGIAREGQGGEGTHVDR